MQEQALSKSYNFGDVPEHVARYPDGPPVFVPGYEASHFMAAAVLAARIGEQAELLVIGAGGGIEMAAFARHCPDWRMTGVDPSQAMLDLATERMRQEAPQTRLQLLQGTAIDAPEGPFDAATAFLCLSFVPDDGSRLVQLKAIRARLRPGAPFLMIHAASVPEALESDFARFALHARLRGANHELISLAVSTNRESIHILSPDREATLLREAGFRLDDLFYKGLWVHGWECTACAD
jgi:tRNA (cmo5U34)-methyltransferase